MTFTRLATRKIKHGDSATVKKIFTKKDLQNFAAITLDTNPLHLDTNFASSTRFKQPVVHGVLTVGLLSGLLGTKLPGAGSIAISYRVEHPNPLFVNEEVVATVTVKELKGRKAMFDMVCKNSHGDIVTKGESVILIPKSAL